jgi:Arc/MetJ-type ribon-helix-helix transcriptional regulator
MRQITVRITAKESDYLDTLISQGMFASYSHSLRGLLYWHKQNQRVIGNLKRENAVLRAKVSGEFLVAVESTAGRFDKASGTQTSTVG